MGVQACLTTQNSARNVLSRFPGRDLAGRQTVSRGQIIRSLMTELMNLYAPSQAHISILLPGTASPAKSQGAGAQGRNIRPI